MTAPGDPSGRLVGALHAVKLRGNRALSAWARDRGWTTTALGYPGYAAGGRARVRGRLLLAPARTAPAARRDLPGWRRLFTLEQPFGEIDVELAGSRVRARADEAGLLDVPLPAVLPPGRADALLHVGGRPPVAAPVYVAAPDAGRGIVCDIDDTVWITGIRHPLRAAWRTFAGNSATRRPVAGMAALLTRVAREHPHSPVVYLSNGPWNLAGAITAFLERNGFPAGALLLTDWGIGPRAWFRSGRAHKRGSLERVAADLPGVRWFLVGDDGEHDPEIYRDFATAHPGRVVAIALRTTAPAGTPSPETGERAGERVGDVPVVRAGDGRALAGLLERAGVLSPIGVR
ncbi:App1 family protein [Geodermatophilus nigrescens]|uniref:Phosphatidate phosphatase APP1 n=1 Tax=Geodermatophilus nigrescens TaxID=1070870 RepID=A0A1M5IAM0_9ACTN|nr:phosphatase domain-containing protein [Geodermatophilus nigrescens]SHG25301.1 Phosphatidate phosphatase APP1 [Geodermatophilus nigrescens]